MSITVYVMRFIRAILEKRVELKEKVSIVLSEFPVPSEGDIQPVEIRHAKLL